MISYQKNHGGLHLLIDSTGLKFLSEGEWKRKKHQPDYRRQWRKLHIGIDAETLQIHAVQLTTNNVSDSQVLGDLLDQISQEEQIDSVYTDGTYDTKHCFRSTTTCDDSAKKKCKAMERDKASLTREK